MCGALYQFFVQVKKLVLLPFQAGAGMWTLVVISKEFAIFMHHKNIPGFAFDFDLETFAARVFNIGSFAKKVCHNVC